MASHGWKGYFGLINASELNYAIENKQTLVKGYVIN